ncbi:sugar phosphate nucleotidyltransferase, partial [Alphaproteobacteria bacterium]|nr:sugar phosphate nucleotidyltransferase [Alphaproteobacteria bacterium]
FIEEKKYLGTAGSLYLVKKYNYEHFLVMNCDVMTNLDLNSFIEYYLSKNFDVLIGASIIKYNIPYGVINDKDGEFSEIEEKPDKSFKVSSGIYIFKKEIFSFIKPNTFLDMPDFLKTLSYKKINIGIFPIHEKWIDVGTPKAFIEQKKNFK